jgi:hypothetical protein
MATPENLNKIDEFVKNSVKDFQPPFDASHWDEFEKTLNSKPKGTAFGRIKFSLNTLIAVVSISALALTGWYFATTPKTDTNKEQNTNALNVNTFKQEEVVKTNPVVNTDNTIVPENNTAQNTETNVVVNTPLNVNSNNVNSNIGVVNNTNNNTNTTQNISNGSNNKTNVNSVKGPTPIYGDMIDPKTGIVKKTKDDPALNEKALDKLLNNDLGLYTKNDKGEYVINKDSLQKIFDLIEQKSKDSAGVQLPSESNIPK